MWKAPFVQYGSARLFLRSAPPSTWPTPVPLQGALAPNDALQTSLERLLDGELPGQPESVVFGDDGRVFAMLEGDVWVAEGPNGSNPQLYAHTGGRPLGGKFDASGNLIYADGTGVSVFPSSRLRRAFSVYVCLGLCWHARLFRGSFNVQVLLVRVRYELFSLTGRNCRPVVPRRGFSWSRRAAVGW
jgi:hypothetical protein